MNAPGSSARGTPAWSRTVEASDDAPHGSESQARAEATPARFCPIGVDRLDELMVIELQAYPYPWSRGNFIDALAAGYLMQGLESLQGELLAYQVAMAGVDEWHLLNLTVAPGHQRRGLALRLLRALARHTVDTGAQDLWLEVRPSNWRALGLYERFGFRQVGLRRGYYPDAHGRREDALVLRWREPGGLADDLD